MCLAAYEFTPLQLTNNTMMLPMPSGRANSMTANTCRQYQTNRIPTHPLTSCSWDAAGIDHTGGIWHSSLPPITRCIFTAKVFNSCYQWHVMAGCGWESVGREAWCCAAMSIDGRAAHSEEHLPPMSCHGAFGRWMGRRHWGGNKYGTNFHGAMCAANVMSCVPVYLVACNCIRLHPPLMPPLPCCPIQWHAIGRQCMPPQCYGQSLHAAHILQIPCHCNQSHAAIMLC